MKIKYHDEADLQRKIAKILNHQGYTFKVTKDFCDLVDDLKKIYVEVKLEHFAPAQILYGLARNDVEDAKYIGLGSSNALIFYKAPDFSKVMKFATMIDPELEVSPSSVNKVEWTDEAFRLLGDHAAVYTYDGSLNLGNNLVFINAKNLEYLKEITDKYGINLYRLIAFYMGVYENKQKIHVTDGGYILNESADEYYKNEPLNPQTRIVGKGYKKIESIIDRLLFESVRIKKGDMLHIRNRFDQLESVKKRRELGRYFTKTILNKKITNIVNKINPSFIIEPYVGAGSLIDSLRDYRGIGNDIRGDIVDNLDYGSKWKFTSLDTIVTQYKTLIERWDIKEGEDLLFLTNPPFGTVSTNRLASKSTKGLLKQGKEPDLVGKSRTIKIEYGTVGDKYGKGDLVIPAVGKLIDFIKKYKSGYLAFFCPAGVFCGRQRYLKLFKALLKDFEFIEGYIFSGENFNSIQKKKPIAFTVWKYHKDINTNVSDISFDYDEKNNKWKLKPLLLLKDGWKYDRRKNGNEIGVGCNMKFNDPGGKFFHLKMHKGGSLVIPENVKIDLGLKIPSELVYGLWSVTVGYRSFTDCPVYIDNAYTHLPDFSKRETMEILAYMVIGTLFAELKGNYCKGLISFKGSYRDFKFGGERLTEGAKYLIETYGDSPIGEKTINDIFTELKNEPDIAKIPISEYRKEIKKQVTDRLEKIGYWDYIPIPSGIFESKKVMKMMSEKSFGDSKGQQVLVGSRQQVFKNKPKDMLKTEDLIK